MSNGRVKVYGADVLRKKARPVEEIDESIGDLIEEMYEVLEEEGGIGLAAPQIGVPLRVIIVSIPADLGRTELSLINPVISAAEGWQEFEEGCLSVPGIYEKVKRRAQITIEGLEPSGATFKGEYEGFPATVFQHEMDHLDGVLFVDRLPRMKRRMLEKELAEISQRAQ